MARWFPSGQMDKTLNETLERMMTVFLMAPRRCRHGGNPDNIEEQPGRSALSSDAGLGGTYF